MLGLIAHMHRPRQDVRHGAAARLIAAVLLSMVAMNLLHAAVPHASASEHCAICRAAHTLVITGDAPGLPLLALRPRMHSAPSQAIPPSVALVDLEAPRGPPLLLAI